VNFEASSGAFVPDTLNPVLADWKFVFPTAAIRLYAVDVKRLPVPDESPTVDAAMVIPLLDHDDVVLVVIKFAFRRQGKKHDVRYCRTGNR
jgi:hypothetical protein